jgi:peptide/nickel transport system permease protein
VRTARAKGVPERGILYRHAFKNAAIPFITVSGLSLGFMLSGAIIIETVFAWPGLGRLIVQAVPGRDFPVIQAGVFVFALIFVALNLVVDLLYAAVDPRVRLG